MDESNTYPENYKGTVAVTFTTADRTTYTLAVREFSANECNTFPCPIALSKLDDEEIAHVKHLTEYLPIWIDQGCGRVLAYDPPKLREWAEKVAAAVDAFKAAEDISTDAALQAMINLQNTALGTARR